MTSARPLRLVFYPVGTAEPWPGFSFWAGACEEDARNLSSQVSGFSLKRIST